MARKQHIKLVSAAKIAELEGVTRQAVYRWLARKSPVPHEVVGSFTFFDPDAVKHWRATQGKGKKA